MQIPVDEGWRVIDGWKAHRTPITLAFLGSAGRFWSEGTVTLARNGRDQKAPNFLEIVEPTTHDIAKHRPRSLIPAYALAYRTEGVFKKARSILARAARVTFAEIGGNGIDGSVQLAGNAFSDRLSTQSLCIVPRRFEEISGQAIRSHAE